MQQVEEAASQKISTRTTIQLVHYSILHPPI